MDEAANNIIPLTGSPLSRRSRENISANVTSFNSFINEQRNFNSQKTRADDYQNVLLQGGQTSVTSLQNQLDGISRELSSLSQNVNTISQTVQQQGTAEQLRLRSEQENQRKLAEKRIAIGKEDELEKRIQSSLASPIVAVQGKVSDLFSRVESAFTTLFLGWLSNSVIEYLKAQSSGDIDKLNQIKGNILKGLAIGIGSLVAVKTGLSLVGRTIGAVTDGVTSLIAKLATAPFKAIGAGISSLSGGRKPSAPSKPGQKPGKTSGGGLLSGIGKVLTGLSGGMNLLNGENVDAALSGLSLIPGKGVVFKGIRVAAATVFTIDEVLEALGKNFSGADPKLLAEKKKLLEEEKKKQNKPSSSSQVSASPQTSSKSLQPDTVAAKSTPSPTSPLTSAPASTSVVSPSTSMMPQASNLTMNVNATSPTATTSSSQEKNVDTGTTPPQASSQQQFPDYSSIFQKSPDQASQPEIKPAAQITPPPKDVNKAGALPEVQPNVIVATGTNTSGSKQTPPSTPPPNPNVPMISSSNPDNFYVLYSQLNYNIVM
jgi:hypothetical protein